MIYDNMEMLNKSSKHVHKHADATSKPQDQSELSYVLGSKNSHCFPMVGMVINLIVEVYYIPMLRIPYFSGGMILSPISGVDPPPQLELPQLEPPSPPVAKKTGCGGITREEALALALGVIGIGGGSWLKNQGAGFQGIFYFHPLLPGVS